MPLRRFKCPKCETNLETLKNVLPSCPAHGLMEEILSAPSAKMMETTDALHGKSKLKNQDKILRERSRNFARDKEADELIQLNRENGIERSGFITKDGKKRKKVDDL